jgi:hypothetical protein
VGEKAENQRKTREKSKVEENQVFSVGFLRQKKDCAYPLCTRVQLVLVLQSHIHLYGPVRNVFDASRSIRVLGQVGGVWALENETFLGPEIQIRA